MKYTVKVNGEIMDEIEAHGIVSAIEIVEEEWSKADMPFAEKIWLDIEAVEEKDDGSKTYAGFWIQPRTQQEKHEDVTCDDREGK